MLKKRNERAEENKEETERIYIYNFSRKIRGKERVDRELDDFLSLDFIPRVGGGIGMTRFIHAMEQYKLSGIVENMHR